MSIEKQINYAMSYMKSNTMRRHVHSHFVLKPLHQELFVRVREEPDQRCLRGLAAGVALAGAPARGLEALEIGCLGTQTQTRIEA
jgi:hypothetical protein